MDLSGQTLGKYELIRRLGKGGMAEVYQANQPTIERLVAVKVLHTHLSESQDFITRFKREARSLGQLQHPHIVRVIDFDAHDDFYYMVMDFIPGQTLRAYLDEKGTLSNEEALFITAQLVDALAYAHQNGTVHRDIKPSNIMFADQTNSHAILTDFGITRLMDDQTITQSGSLVGTPAYMSPEAVMGERVDGRTDIYSLGVILYEMVTGRTPYEGNTPLSVVVKQVHEPLPSPLIHRPDLPIPLVRLIEKALTKEINLRFQTAEEFLKAIQSTQATLQFPVSHFSPAQTTADLPAVELTLPVDDPAVESPAGAGRRRLFYAGWGILMLAVVGAGFLLMRSRQNSAPAFLAATIPPSPPVAETSIPAAASTAAVVAALPSSAPTSVPATQTTQPTPTSTRIIPTATPVPPPLVEPGRTGTLRLLDGENGRLTGYLLQVDRVPQPAGRAHFELWFEAADGRLLNLGPVPVADRQIRVEGQVDENILAAFDRVLITLEEDEGAVLSTPGQLIFNGELGPMFQAGLRRLLVNSAESTALLTRSEEQTALALQHTQFATSAISQDDLLESKRHIEHVLNILDGETGDLFGDLNLDGQVQNPGDGWGVRAYLLEIQAQLEQLVSNENTPLEPQYRANQALITSNDALTILDLIYRQGSPMVATDTTSEAQPFVDEIQNQMDRLLTTHNRLVQETMGLVAYPLIHVPGDIQAPDPIAGYLPGQTGLFVLLNQDTNLAGGYQLQLERLPQLAETSQLSAWLVHSQNDETQFLGNLDVVQNQAYLNGQLNRNLLGTFDQIVIAISPAGEPTEIPPDNILFRGAAQPEINRVVITLLAPDLPAGKGAILGAVDQTTLARQHFQFSQEALHNGDMGGALTHLEHVVNILDGQNGTFFGDLNGDGQRQNPGDNIGVRAYWQQALSALQQLRDNHRLTGNQQFALNQMTIMAQSNEAVVETALQQAIKVFATDTTEEAQPFMDNLNRQIEALLMGNDWDGNGAIDLLYGEGGALAMADLALMLNEVAIFEIEPE